MLLNPSWDNQGECAACRQLNSHNLGFSSSISRSSTAGIPSALFPALRSWGNLPFGAPPHIGLIQPYVQPGEIGLEVTSH